MGALSEWEAGATIAVASGVTAAPCAAGAEVALASGVTAGGGEFVTFRLRLWRDRSQKKFSLGEYAPKTRCVSIDRMPRDPAASWSSCS